MYKEGCADLVLLRHYDLSISLFPSCGLQLWASDYMVSATSPSPGLLLTAIRLANLTEASQIIDYICMCWIYLYFHRALKAQGYDRKDLPYVGWAQPYCAYAGLGTMIFTVSCYGYATFLPGCKFLLYLNIA